MNVRVKPSFCLLAIVCWLSAYGVAQESVLTSRNDNSRTGQNLNETILNTSNVNVSNFGKVFFRTVDEYVYAQPLYFPNLNIQGQTRNVIFVATENNTVYAFDADDPVATAPLWQVNLGIPVLAQDICTSQPAQQDGCNGLYYGDIGDKIGITSTPVIDPITKTLYVVAKTKDTSNPPAYHFFLHALDLPTGQEKFAGPTEITVAGAPVNFIPLNQLQRPALLLLNGVLYMAFGSAGDFYVWHGWVMAYDAATLQQLAYFVSTPGNQVFDSGGEMGGGGIFAAGGLVADSANVYLMTGNGPFDGSANFGDSLLKLSAPQLTRQDFFTPQNASYLGANNVDLGAGGVMMIPGTSLLVGGGKDGLLRLFDSNNLGKFNASHDNNLQNFSVTSSAWIFGTPTFWSGPNGQWIYLWVSGGQADAYPFNGSPTAPAIQTSPISHSTLSSPGGETDTSPMSLSANGSQAGTGILWAPIANSTGPIPGVIGVLHAFDASNLANDLWNSELDSARDEVGTFVKFNPPTVANGKVYVPTSSGQVVVYGLNPVPAGIRFVQVAAATPSSGSQVSQAFTTTETAGDLNIVVISSDTTSKVTSVRDSLGNSYALAVGPTTGTANTQWIYYAKNIAAGIDTITVIFNQTTSYPELRIVEYAGLDTVSPLDVSSGGAGSGVQADSGPATTTAANELIFAANTVATSNLGQGSPFISRLQLPGGDLVEDRIVNVANTYDANSPLGSQSLGVLQSGSWVMQMATFKAASAAGDFSISASPSSASVNTGSSVNDVISVSGLNGFSSPVTLACSGLPSGASCSFNPASLSPNSNPATSTLTISAASGTTANTYNVTITGTAGSLNHNTSVSLTVAAAADFSISATSPVTVAAGSAIASTVSVSPTNGFNAAVGLACSAGLPTGAVCSFNPASVTGSGNSTLNITTTAATPIGSYPITVNGTSGSLTNAATVMLTVTAGGGSFSLSTPSPASAMVTAGGSATFTTTVTPSGSFGGTVTLSCAVVTNASPAPACASANVTVNGAAVQTTLTATTTAPHASLAPSSRIFYAMLLPWAGMTLLGASGGSRRKKMLSFLLMFLAVSGLLFLTACGGGSSSSGGGGKTGGTPAGTYTITVTGTSGSLTQNTTFTLVVQ